LPDTGALRLFPGDDIAREVVQYRAQIEPAPAGHLQIGEVGLPKLVLAKRFVGFDLATIRFPALPRAGLEVLLPGLRAVDFLFPTVDRFFR
jgi:hypothetical protein